MWRTFRLVSQLLQRRPGAWRNLLFLQNLPGIRSDAFSVQLQLLRHNDRWPPTTSTTRLWQMIGTFCATCPCNQTAPWWTMQQHAWEQQHQFPPLLTDDLLRNCFLQCQSQSVSKWTFEEVRHAPHDRGALLQQVWQNDGVQRHKYSPQCRRPERLRYIHMTLHACFRVILACAVTRSAAGTASTGLSCIARRTRWNLSSWLSGESIAVATVPDDMSTSLRL